MLNLIFFYHILFFLLFVTILNLNPKFINIIICIMINFSQLKNDIIFNELILKFILKTHERNILPNIIYCFMFTKINYKKSSVSKDIK